jgi:hypothetical protein
MKRRKTISLICFFTLVIALMPVQPGWEARGQSDRFSGRTITGTVYFIGGRTAGRSLSFRLIIKQLTTPDEVNQLNEALSGGQDQLLKVLSKMDAGRIQIGSDVGVPANAIIASQEGDRTKLTVLYQRNLRFAELRFGARSADYRFGYSELYLGPGGGNEGMLIPAAKVRLKGGNTWEVEDFGTFPARLMGLQIRGKGRSDIR